MSLWLGRAPSVGFAALCFWDSSGPGTRRLASPLALGFFAFSLRHLAVPSSTALAESSRLAWSFPGLFGFLKSIVPFSPNRWLTGQVLPDGSDCFPRRVPVHGLPRRPVPVGYRRSRFPAGTSTLLQKVWSYVSARNPLKQVGKQRRSSVGIVLV